MSTGAPRHGELIHTRRTVGFRALNGTDAIGGTERAPTYWDDEFKADTDAVRCPLLRARIVDSAHSVVLWQDSQYRFYQLYTGAQEVWDGRGIALEPQSAKADAFNNGDHLAILSAGESFYGSFGVYVE